MGVRAMVGYFRVRVVGEGDREKSRATLERFLSPEEREEAAETLRRFKAAQRRISAESAALRRRYPDQWIAMDAAGGVLAAADTRGELRRKIAARGGSMDGIACRWMDGDAARRVLVT